VSQWWHAVPSQNQLRSITDRADWRTYDGVKFWRLEPFYFDGSMMQYSNKYQAAFLVPGFAKYRNVDIVDAAPMRVTSSRGARDWLTAVEARTFNILSGYLASRHAIKPVSLPDSRHQDILGSCVCRDER